jgi:hypothetical protein
MQRHVDFKARISVFVKIYVWRLLNATKTIKKSGKGRAGMDSLETFTLLLTL